MAPFAESRNFRGWWVSKTPLEQKLIILSSVLFILSFCLTISVIVLDNRKPPACPSTTTVAPSTNATEKTTLPPETPTETEPPTTEPPTTDPPAPPPKKEDKDNNKGKEDKQSAPEALIKSSSPDITNKEDKDTTARAWADENPEPETLMSSPDEAFSSRRV